ncbi:NAC domain-containing protein [Quillaja saponaria]|uniref:NAC domain-containing protein n=1 Tax=Quillaja saponaria TaxID=32244 RepID=A0AAD7VDF7_QUISA|nr:NAC domain-containing protein [Quillaja saponaria]
MEKPSFVINGGIKLPVGYRFRPTDEELVIHYLKRKVFGVPLPASVIPEFDVFQTEPWGLPGDLKEKRYFFSHGKGNACENMSKKGAGFGYWKSTGKDKAIIASQSNQVAGMRKTLIFFEGKTIKTHWVMHELSFVGSSQVSKRGMEDWVVYCIFQKRRPKKIGFKAQLSNSNKVQRLEEVKPSFIDVHQLEHSNDTGPPQPSSPCSNGGSEITSSHQLLDQDQEESSAYIKFSSLVC